MDKLLERYQPTIGLEVQMQANTKSKAYCGCANIYGAEPNTHVCPVCTAQPGSLPVPNRGVFEKAIRIALALGSKIARQTHFDRKNYFYPDLPKGYQITQHPCPIGSGGMLRFPGERYGAEADAEVSIERVHMEEDTAKSNHDATGKTLIDFNRAGVPLLEIVTEPCIHEPRVAYAYLLNMMNLLEYLDVSTCSMEEGSLRVDTNISLARPGGSELGSKVEVKNINSFKAVQAALEYEIVRQAELLDAGKSVMLETRHWDNKRGITLPGRSKESSMDYRFFSEPDIPPLMVGDEWFAEIKTSMPELPRLTREKLIADGLSPYDAWVLVFDKPRYEYFVEVVEAGASSKPAVNWVNGDLAALLKESEYDYPNCPLSPAYLTELIALREGGKLSGKAAKEVLERAFNGEGAPGAIVEKHNLGQMSDSSEVEAIVRQAIEDNPNEVEQYRAGKTKLAKFFVGQVMKATRGKAEARLVNELVTKLLDE
jgi:aspartyl-tRNA(Asn)/glutamyl-tRNA(Gln) amidotransferase subunit B